MVDIIGIIQELVANVGFPIACVIMMFIQTEKEREAHRQESDKWTEAINNNTIVMEKILARLEACKNEQAS